MSPAIDVPLSMFVCCAGKNELYGRQTMQGRWPILEIPRPLWARAIPSVPPLFGVFDSFFVIRDTV